MVQNSQSSYSRAPPDSIVAIEICISDLHTVFLFLTPFVLNVYCKLTWLNIYTMSPLYF